MSVRFARRRAVAPGAAQVQHEPLDVPQPPALLSVQIQSRPLQPQPRLGQSLPQAWNTTLQGQSDIHGVSVDKFTGADDTAHWNAMDRMVASVQPGMDVQASREFVQRPWVVATSDGSRQRGDGREMRNWKTRQRWISAQTYCRTREPGSRTLTRYPCVCFCIRPNRKLNTKAIGGLGGLLDVAALPCPPRIVAKHAPAR